jgi:hypothetical protein
MRETRGANDRAGIYWIDGDYIQGWYYAPRTFQNQILQFNTRLGISAATSAVPPILCTRLMPALHASKLSGLHDDWQGFV